MKVYCFPPNVGCSEKSLLCYVATFMSGEQLTASVRSDHLLHGHTLPVFFAIGQWRRPPRSAEIQPMSQQAAAATCSYCG